MTGLEHNPVISHSSNTFTDPEIAECFRQCHLATAQLWLINTRLSLSLGGIKRIKKLIMPVRIVGVNGG